MTRSPIGPHRLRFWNQIPSINLRSFGHQKNPAEELSAELPPREHSAAKPEPGTPRQQQLRKEYQERRSAVNAWEDEGGSTPVREKDSAESSAPKRHV